MIARVFGLTDSLLVGSILVGSLIAPALIGPAGLKISLVIVGAVLPVTAVLGARHWQRLAARGTTKRVALAAPTRSAGDAALAGVRPADRARDPGHPRGRGACAGRDRADPSRRRARRLLRHPRGRVRGHPTLSWWGPGSMNRPRSRPRVRRNRSARGRRARQPSPRAGGGCSRCPPPDCAPTAARQQPGQGAAHSGRPLCGGRELGADRGRRFGRCRPHRTHGVRGRRRSNAVTPRVLCAAAPPGGLLR